METLNKFVIKDHEIPDVYKYIFHDNSFIKLFYGSRNSGKSDAAALRKLSRALSMPYFKCLMVRKVQRAVKKSIYDKLKSVAKRHRIDHLFKFNDHLAEVICIENGNKFMSLGTYETLDSGGNAKSVDDPTDALIDEMDELSEKEFKSLMFSIRGCDDLEIIGVFNTNKIDEEHWIFKRWFPSTSSFEKPDGMHTYVRSTRPGTSILHTNYLMNPWAVSNQKLVQAFLDEKEKDFEYYELHGLGLIKTVKSVNSALPSYDPKEHIDKGVKFNPNAIAYFHWDFNRLPHHTVGLSQFGGADSDSYYWNFVTEFCLEGKSIDQVQEEINTWLKRNGYMLRRVIIVCDYSGKTKRDHGKTTDVARIHQGLRKGGYTPEDRTLVNPSVTASLGFLNSIFGEDVKMSPRSSNPEAILKIRIHPSCKFHCDDFKKTTTDREGKLMKVTRREQFIEDGVKVLRTYQIRGHGVDGVRYLFVSIFGEEYIYYISKYTV